MGLNGSSQSNCSSRQIDSEADDYVAYIDDVHCYAAACTNPEGVRVVVVVVRFQLHCCCTGGREGCTRAGSRRLYRHLNRMGSDHMRTMASIGQSKGDECITRRRRHARVLNAHTFVSTEWHYDIFAPVHDVCGGRPVRSPYPMPTSAPRPHDVPGARILCEYLGGIFPPKE